MFLILVDNYDLFYCPVFSLKKLHILSSSSPESPVFILSSGKLVLLKLIQSLKLNFYCYLFLYNLFSHYFSFFSSIILHSLTLFYIYIYIYIYIYNFIKSSHTAYYCVVDYNWLCELKPFIYILLYQHD